MRKGSFIVCVLALGMSTTIADLVSIEAEKVGETHPASSAGLEVLAIMIFIGIPIWACIWWNSREKG